MYPFRKITIAIPAILAVFALTSGNAGAQYHNLYPCNECAVYDNNGHDLRGFVTSNKKELEYRGSKLTEYSANDWGYLEVKTAHTPSVDQKGYLNHTEYINTTLALCKTGDVEKATWWGRQCNTPKGPLVAGKADRHGDVGMDLARYQDVMHDLEFKKFTLVEYYSDDYNQLDYDVLLKNYVLARKGVISDISDLKTIISFCDTFLTKFTYLDDPLLQNKSYVTFVTAGKNKYMIYFNLVNNKLAGRLEKVDIQYEKDKETIVDNTCRQLSGKVIFVYGDDIYNLEKTFLNYGHSHKLKLVRRTPANTRNFNTDKQG